MLIMKTLCNTPTFLPLSSVFPAPYPPFLSHHPYAFTLLEFQMCDEISPIEPMTPCSMLHVKMDVGAKPWEFPVAEENQAFIYVRQGDLTLVPTEEGYFEGEEDRGPQVRFSDLEFRAYRERERESCWCS